jgi:hypothetical protein
MPAGHGNSAGGDVGQKAAIALTVIVYDNFFFFFYALQFSVSHLLPPVLSATFISTKACLFQAQLAINHAASLQTCLTIGKITKSQNFYFIPDHIGGVFAGDDFLMEAGRSWMSIA